MKLYCIIFFFNDTATTEIYTLSLHDALPILPGEVVTANVYRRKPSFEIATTETVLEPSSARVEPPCGYFGRCGGCALQHVDRKSTRLNSSHANISYAVFCLKKKKKLI